MKRKLFTFFSTLSLLLCVAACVLWVRSHWVSDVLIEWFQQTVRRQACLGSGFAGRGSSVV